MFPEVRSPSPHPSERDILRKSYAEDGYVSAKQIFSTESLAMLRQSLYSVLEKDGTNTAHQDGTLEDLILNPSLTR